MPKFDVTVMRYRKLTERYEAWAVEADSHEAAIAAVEAKLVDVDEREWDAISEEIEGQDSQASECVEDEVEDGGSQDA